MWGNKEGWLISIVIVTLMALLLWQFDMLVAPAVARPSGQFTHLREPIALPVSPEAALPGVVTEDRDAGDLYWKAIAEYSENQSVYDKFEPKDRDRLGELKAVALLVDAAPAQRATVFLKKPETLVTYSYSGAELEALYRLGIMANSIAFSAQARSDEAETRKYAHACFSLGAKLYEERLIHGELDAGIKLMQTAGDTLKALAKRQGDTKGVEHWQHFGDQTGGYYTSKVQKLFQKVSSAGAIDVGTHAGDVFELALHNPDRMWRTEALLKLGRYKFELGGTVGDQLWATRLLTEPDRFGLPDFSKDKDPAVATAARIARELKQEDLSLIR